MSRTRALTALALLASVAGIAAPALSASVAHAAPAVTRFEVRPIAASSSFLVYVKAPEEADGRPGPGAIYYRRTATGKAHLLATRTHIGSAAAHIAGSMLVYSSDATAAASDTAPLLWRDLSTGAHGTLPQQQTITTPTGTAVTATFVGVAPKGWILESDVAGPDHLYLQTPSGSLSDLGAPEPTGDNPGEGTTFDQLVVSTSSTALVVRTGQNDEAGDNNGSASVLLWSKPTEYRRFVGLSTNRVTYCGSVTSKYIACTLDEFKTTLKDSVRLYSTSGKLLIATTRQRGFGYVIGDALGAFATRGTRNNHHQLSITTPTGTLREAPGPIDAVAFSGLGGVIVTRDQATAGWDRKIVLVTSNGHERTVVSEK